MSFLQRSRHRLHRLVLRASPQVAGPPLSPPKGHLSDVELLCRTQQEAPRSIISAFCEAFMVAFLGHFVGCMWLISAQGAGHDGAGRL